MGNSLHNPVEPLEPRRLFAAGDVLSTAVNPANGHTYHLLAAAAWAAAEAAAAQLRGHLVSVLDAAEQAWVWSTFGPQAPLFWTGFNDADRDGFFEWSSLGPVPYTNWAAGQPDNAAPSGEIYAAMSAAAGGAWVDLGDASPEGPAQFAVAEVTGGADLFVRLSATPQSAAAGQAIPVSSTVRNGGSAEVTGAIPVAFHLSADAQLDAGDPLIGSATTNGDTLAFGDSQLADATVTIPAGTPAGRYRLLAVVDPAGATAEADESNNVTASDWVDVGGNLAPVRRTLTGFVRDSRGGPLNGVRVAYDGAETHTDYDGARARLDKRLDGDFALPNVTVGFNVSFGGAFSHFRPAGATEQLLALSAADLAGGTHGHTVTLTNVLTYNGGRPDGGIGRFASAGALTIPGYAAAADDGRVLLHRDLRNDRNSVRPGLRAPKQLAAGPRYRQTVAAVTAKLSALGFRGRDGSPLPAAEKLSKRSPAKAAVQLFEDITTGYAAADPTAVAAKPRRPAGVVNEAFVAALNDLDPATPFWTTGLPAGWSAADGLTANWISRPTFERLAALSAAVPSVTAWTLARASRPAGGTESAGFPLRAGRAGADVAFGWVNSAGASVAGGTFWEPVPGGRATAVKRLGGKRLAIPDPAQLNVTWRYRADYDAARTADAIRAVLAGGAARVAFNDPQLLQDLGAIRIADGTVTLLRPDLTPAAGYDAPVGARLRT